jgi:myo-inositol 2-dehydrogenase/D-chiro-inositol 1-dehydrogenase
MSGVRIGVIGAGRMGRVHAENVAYRVPAAELLVVADPEPETARACAAACRAGGWTTNYHQVLEDPAVQAVVVAAPTDTHARIIQEAAREGKDIFCEKPIDLSLPRTDEALAAVERAGVRLQIGFNRRFDPSFVRARYLVASGQIGDPHLIRVTSRDPRLPAPEYLASCGGLFADMTIHDFDIVRWLLDEPLAISAVGAALIDPTLADHGDVDTAIVTLRFGRGTLGAIDNSRRSVYGYDVRVEVFGSDGAVVVGNMAPSHTRHLTAAGATGETPVYWFIERFEQAYVNEMREFVSAIHESRSPAVTGHDGRVPLVMAAAARRALAERREVRLDEALATPT